MKTCTKCGLNKPLGEFHAHPNGLFGKANHCKACRRTYARAYYLKNRERKLAQMREWKKANPGRTSELWREWFERGSADPEWLAEFKRRGSERGAAWRRGHPDLVNAFSAARRARKRGAAGGHSLKDWLRLCERWGNKCSYCGAGEPLTRDHVIPLSRGGSDFIGNIRPACKSCNSSKSNRTVMEWRAASA